MLSYLQVREEYKKLCLKAEKIAGAKKKSLLPKPKLLWRVTSDSVEEMAASSQRDTLLVDFDKLDISNMSVSFWPWQK